MSDGDNIIVRKIPEVTNYVDIKGKVKKPGRYPFITGMRVLDIMNLAGGMHDSTFTKGMYLNKAQLIKKTF